jgi:hypothetical protein
VGGLLGSFVFASTMHWLQVCGSYLELEISHHMVKNLRRSVSRAPSDQFVGCVLPAFGGYR